MWSPSGIVVTPRAQGAGGSWALLKGHPTTGRSALQKGPGPGPGPGLGLGRSGMTSLRWQWMTHRWSDVWVVGTKGSTVREKSSESESEGRQRRQRSGLKKGSGPREGGTMNLRSEVARTARRAAIPE